jgi:hypothetical protein
MLTPTQFQQPPGGQGTPPTPPPPPSYQGVPFPGTPGVIDDTGALQSLVEQVAALRAQQRVLIAQMRSRDPGVARSAQQALPGVEAQLAKTSVDLEMLRARIRARQNPWQGQPPGRDRARPNADQITIMSLAFIFAVLMPMSIAISRRIFRRGSRRTAEPSVDTISPRLDRIEQAVDAMAIEVERISEGQRFVTKVLVERPAQTRAATARPATVSGSHDAPSHNNTPKPFLALGAGPIEPIRVPERQAVRQSVTPH